VSLCASCGIERWDGVELCPQHDAFLPDDWAEGNRLLCDLLHRGKEPPRLAAEFRNEPLTQWSVPSA
jgi:hypothetical protein